MNVSSNLRQLLKKYGFAFIQPALQQVVGQSPSTMENDAQYCINVAAVAWKAAPLQMRLMEPASLGWDVFMLEARNLVFDTAATRVSLKPDWEQILARCIDQDGQVASTSTSIGSQAQETVVAAAAASPVVASPAAGRPGPTDGGSSVSAGQAAGSGATSGSASGSGVVPKNVPLAVGIDLGTTYSVVAHLDHQGRPTSIKNASGDILTPSVVLFDEDGNVVGKEAVLAAALEPDKVADCVKRDMGSKYYHKKINGEQLPPEVISSLILRRLKTDAEKKLGPVSRAVITVPAYFDETRRRATMDAGRLAGLQVLDILNEPTAAAISYGYQEGFLERDGRIKSDRPLQVLVYDLGGGTFDVTIVKMSGQSFEALATDGDVRLGGKDWDEKLIDLGAERVMLQGGSDPRTNPASYQDLVLAAENAKKTLTERSKATMFVNHLGKRYKVEVTRQEFDEATAPLLLRTRTTTEIVVMQAGLTWEQIDKILLVGGSTRMPMVPKMLKELSGKDPDHTVSVDEAVAHGAALYADLLVQKQGLGDGHTEFSITNVNSHSLGVVGIEPSTGRRVNAILIKKNTPLPHSASRRFKTAKTNQTNVKICVLEGESELPEACTEVGVCLIRDLPPNLPAGWPVEVKFMYRENGRLYVAGKLSGHSATVTTEFIRDSSLSDDDLMLWAECLAADAQRQEA